MHASERQADRGLPPRTGLEAENEGDYELGWQEAVHEGNAAARARARLIRALYIKSGVAPPSSPGASQLAAAEQIELQRRLVQRQLDEQEDEQERDAAAQYEAFSHQWDEQRRTSSDRARVHSEGDPHAAEVARVREGMARARVWEEEVARGVQAWAEAQRGAAAQQSHGPLSTEGSVVPPRAATGAAAAAAAAASAAASPWSSSARSHTSTTSDFSSDDARVAAYKARMTDVLAREGRLPSVTSVSSPSGVATLQAAGAGAGAGAAAGGDAASSMARKRVKDLLRSIAHIKKETAAKAPQASQVEGKDGMKEGSGISTTPASAPSSRVTSEPASRIAVPTDASSTPSQPQQPPQADLFDSSPAGASEKVQKSHAPAKDATSTKSVLSSDAASAPSKQSSLAAVHAFQPPAASAAAPSPPVPVPTMVGAVQTISTGEPKNDAVLATESASAAAQADSAAINLPSSSLSDATTLDATKDAHVSAATVSKHGEQQQPATSAVKPDSSTPMRDSSDPDFNSARLTVPPVRDAPVSSRSYPPREPPRVVLAAGVPMRFSSAQKAFDVLAVEGKQKVLASSGGHVRTVFDLDVGELDRLVVLAHECRRAGLRLSKGNIMEHEWMLHTPFATLKQLVELSREERGLVQQRKDTPADVNTVDSAALDSTSAESSKHVETAAPVPGPTSTASGSSKSVETATSEPAPTGSKQSTEEVATDTSKSVDAAAAAPQLSKAADATSDFDPDFDSPRIMVPPTTHETSPPVAWSAEIERRLDESQTAAGANEAAEAKMPQSEQLKQSTAVAEDAQKEGQQPASSAAPKETLASTTPATQVETRIPAASQPADQPVPPQEPVPATQQAREQSVAEVTEHPSDEQAGQSTTGATSSVSMPPSRSHEWTTMTREQYEQYLGSLSLAQLRVEEAQLAALLSSTRASLLALSQTPIPALAPVSEKLRAQRRLGHELASWTQREACVAKEMGQRRKESERRKAQVRSAGTPPASAASSSHAGSGASGGPLKGQQGFFARLMEADPEEAPSPLVRRITEAQWRLALVANADSMVMDKDMPTFGTRGLRPLASSTAHPVAPWPNALSLKLSDEAGHRHEPFGSSADAAVANAMLHHWDSTDSFQLGGAREFGDSLIRLEVCPPVISPDRDRLLRQVCDALSSSWYTRPPFVEELLAIMRVCETDSSRIQLYQCILSALVCHTRGEILLEAPKRWNVATDLVRITVAKEQCQEALKWASGALHMAGVRRSEIADASTSKETPTAEEARSSPARPWVTMPASQLPPALLPALNRMWCVLISSQLRLGQISSAEASLAEWKQWDPKASEQHAQMERMIAHTRSCLYTAGGWEEFAELQKERVLHALDVADRKGWHPQEVMDVLGGVIALSHAALVRPRACVHESLLYARLATELLTFVNPTAAPVVAPSESATHSPSPDSASPSFTLPPSTAGRIRAAVNAYGVRFALELTGVGSVPYRVLLHPDNLSGVKVFLLALSSSTGTSDPSIEALRHMQVCQMAASVYVQLCWSCEEVGQEKVAARAFAAAVDVAQFGACTDEEAAAIRALISPATVTNHKSAAPASDSSSSILAPFGRFLRRSLSDRDHRTGGGSSKDTSSGESGAGAGAGAGGQGRNDGPKGESSWRSFRRSRAFKWAVLGLVAGYVVIRANPPIAPPATTEMCEAKLRHAWRRVTGTIAPAGVSATAVGADAVASGDHKAAELLRQLALELPTLTSSVRQQVDDTLAACVQPISAVASSATATTTPTATPSTVDLASDLRDPTNPVNTLFNLDAWMAQQQAASASASAGATLSRMDAEEQLRRTRKLVVAMRVTADASLKQADLLLGGPVGWVADDATRARVAQQLLHECVRLCDRIISLAYSNSPRTSSSYRMEHVWGQTARYYFAKEATRMLNVCDSLGVVRPVANGPTAHGEALGAGTKAPRT